MDRKTFYQHFGSVEGLLDAIAEEVVCELLDGVEQVMGEREPSGGAKAGDALSAFFDVLARSLAATSSSSSATTSTYPPSCCLSTSHGRCSARLWSAGS